MPTSSNLPSSHPTTPLVSVILPTYNRAHLLIETLESLYHQPYRPLELLIIDDGSTDETQTVLTAWIQHHQTSDFQCRPFSQKNQGVCAARNLGLDQSSGVYLHFLDSDDLVAPAFYTTLVSILSEHPSCAFAWANHLTSADPQATYQSLKPIPIPPSEIHHQPPNTVWSGLYRRSALPPTLRWDTTLKSHNDWDFTTRFLLSDPPEIRHVPIPLFIYRVHSSTERITLHITPEGLCCVRSCLLKHAQTVQSHPVSSYQRALRIRFSTEAITLLYSATVIENRSLQWQSARLTCRFATRHQHWFWNAIAFLLICNIPISRTPLGHRFLRFIQYHLSHP